MAEVTADATETIGPVFLSASVPAPDRDPQYFSTADVVAIRESVLALTMVVTPRSRLVFGGHPAISPLVHLAADQIGFAQNVAIYQSEFFRSIIPPSSLSFRDLRWTPATVGDRSASLAAMRTEMLASEAFGAGVFVGGMEGVELEYDMFVRAHPNARALLVASTGAAAQKLYGELPAAARDRGLERDPAYRSLFRRLLRP